MNWELKLIALYLWVCEGFEEGAAAYAQRLSKNTKSFELGFTDEEAVTVYLYGITRKYTEVKDIHRYTKDHLLDWFPKLPSYEKFNSRLNFLNNVFGALAGKALSEQRFPQWLVQGRQMPDAVVDSMPIILAMGSRADSAKVAVEVANKGRCASKGFYYHGLKLHQLGLCCPNRMPIPKSLLLSGASENDNTFFKEQIAPMFSCLRVYGDKIYHDEAGRIELKRMFGIEVLPSQRRKKGQKHLKADQKIFSTLVSRIRQPVESFFNWINQKTGIQIASKVRSLKGLFKHVYAKLTAGLLILIGF
ncbi:MAG: transposase [Bacteroidota bacterium]